MPVLLGYDLHEGPPGKTRLLLELMLVTQQQLFPLDLITGSRSPVFCTVGGLDLLWYELMKPIEREGVVPFHPWKIHTGFKVHADFLRLAR